MFTINKLTRRIAAALGLVLAAATSASAGDFIGTTFPADFPVIIDNSLGVPVIGFGGAGKVKNTPVIFLHDNDETPYWTACQRMNTSMQRMAQYFADNGYAASELWALGYQGDQCDNFQTNGFISGWTNSASAAHTVAQNVPDLRKFVKAVMSYTGASKVDIVAHGMGVVLAREYARQDGGAGNVRRFVAIDGPNQGMIICANVATGNHWQYPMEGGFTPDSAVCNELGSPNTPFLTQLNKTDKRIKARDTLVIRNGDVSYLFTPYPYSDGLIAGVPSVDSYGNDTNFSTTGDIPGVPYWQDIVLTGQGPAVPVNTLNSAHVGIANSPVTWGYALDFLKRRW